MLPHIVPSPAKRVAPAGPGSAAWSTSDAGDAGGVAGSMQSDAPATTATTTTKAVVRYGMYDQPRPGQRGPGLRGAGKAAKGRKGQQGQTPLTSNATPHDQAGAEQQVYSAPAGRADPPLVSERAGRAVGARWEVRAGVEWCAVGADVALKLERLWRGEKSRGAVGHDIADFDASKLITSSGIVHDLRRVRVVPAGGDSDGGAGGALSLTSSPASPAVKAAPYSGAGHLDPPNPQYTETISDGTWEDNMAALLRSQQTQSPPNKHLYIIPPAGGGHAHADPSPSHPPPTGSYSLPPLQGGAAASGDGPPPHDVGAGSAAENAGGSAHSSRFGTPHEREGLLPALCATAGTSPSRTLLPNTLQLQQSQGQHQHQHQRATWPLDAGGDVLSSCPAESPGQHTTTTTTARLKTHEGADHGGVHSSTLSMHSSCVFGSTAPGPAQKPVQKKVMQAPVPQIKELAAKYGSAVLAKREKEYETRIDRWRVMRGMKTSVDLFKVTERRARCLYVDAEEEERVRLEETEEVARHRISLSERVVQRKAATVRRQQAREKRRYELLLAQQMRFREQQAVMARDEGLDRRLNLLLEIGRFEYVLRLQVQAEESLLNTALSHWDVSTRQALIAAREEWVRQNQLPFQQLDEMETVARSELWLAERSDRKNISDAVRSAIREERLRKARAQALAEARHRAFLQGQEQERAELEKQEHGVRVVLETERSEALFDISRLCHIESLHVVELLGVKEEEAIARQVVMLEEFDASDAHPRMLIDILSERAFAQVLEEAVESRRLAALPIVLHIPHPQVEWVANAAVPVPLLRNCRIHRKKAIHERMGEHRFASVTLTVTPSTSLQGGAGGGEFRPGDSIRFIPPVPTLDDRHTVGAPCGKPSRKARPRESLVRRGNCFFRGEKVVAYLHEPGQGARQQGGVGGVGGRSGQFASLGLALAKRAGKMSAANTNTAAAKHDGGGVGAAIIHKLAAAKAPPQAGGLRPLKMPAIVLPSGGDVNADTPSSQTADRLAKRRRSSSVHSASSSSPRFHKKSSSGNLAPLGGSGETAASATLTAGDLVPVAASGSHTPRRLVSFFALADVVMNAKQQNPHPTGAQPEDEDDVIWGDGDTGPLCVRFVAREGEVKGYDVEDVLRGLVFYRPPAAAAVEPGASGGRARRSPQPTPRVGGGASLAGSASPSPRSTKGSPRSTKGSPTASPKGSPKASPKKRGRQHSSTPSVKKTLREDPHPPAEREREPLTLSVNLVTELDDVAGHLPYWMAGVVTLDFAPPVLIAPRAHAVMRLPPAPHGGGAAAALALSSPITASLSIDAGDAAAAGPLAPLLQHLPAVQTPPEKSFAGYVVTVRPVIGATPDDDVVIRDNKQTIAEDWLHRGDFHAVDDGVVCETVVCRTAGGTCAAGDGVALKTLRMELSGAWTPSRMDSLLRCVCFGPGEGRVCGKRVYEVKLHPPAPMPEIAVLDCSMTSPHGRIPPVFPVAGLHTDPPTVLPTEVLVEITVVQAAAGASTLWVLNEHWARLVHALDSVATVHRWWSRWQWRTSWDPKTLKAAENAAAATVSSPAAAAAAAAPFAAPVPVAPPPLSTLEEHEMVYERGVLPGGLSRTSRAVYDDGLPFAVYRGADRSQTPRVYLPYTRNHAVQLFPFLEVLSAGGDDDDYVAGEVTLTCASGYAEGDQLAFSSDLLDELRDQRVGGGLGRMGSLTPGSLSRRDSMSVTPRASGARRARLVLAESRRVSRDGCGGVAGGAGGASWTLLPPGPGDAGPLDPRERTLCEDEGVLPNGGVRVKFAPLSRRFLQRFLRSATYAVRPGVPLPKPTVKVIHIEARLTSSAVNCEEGVTETVKETRYLKTLPPAVSANAKAALKFKEGDGWQPLPGVEVTKEKESDFSFLDGGVLAVSVVGDLTEAQAQEDELTFLAKPTGKHARKGVVFDIAEGPGGWSIVSKKEKAETLVLGRFKQPAVGEPLIVHLGDPKAAAFAFRATSFPPSPPKYELGVEVARALCAGGVKSPTAGGAAATPKVTMKLLKALVSAVYYRNVSRDPSDVEKFIQVSVVDALGVWSETLLPLVTVAVNDPTEIVLPYPKVAFTQDTNLTSDGGIPLFTDTSLEDVDTEATGEGYAFISVDIKGGRSVGDSLALRGEGEDGGVDVVGTGVFVTGQQVGTIVQRDARAPLMVKLKREVPLVQCAQVMRAIHFDNSVVPARAGDRVIAVKFNAGDGVADSKARVDVSVQPPLLFCPKAFARVRYVEGSGAMPVASRMACGLQTCTDPTLVSLTVSLRAGGVASEDELLFPPGGAVTFDAAGSALNACDVGGRSAVKIAEVVERSPLGWHFRLCAGAGPKLTPQKALASIMQALRYTNHSNKPTEVDRVLSFTVAVEPVVLPDTQIDPMAMSVATSVTAATLGGLPGGDDPLREYPGGMLRETSTVEVKLAVVGLDDPTEIEPIAPQVVYVPPQGIAFPQPFYPFADCSVEDPDTPVFPKGSVIRIELFAGTASDNLQQGRDVVDGSFDADSGIDVEKADPAGAVATVVWHGDVSGEPRIVATKHFDTKGSSIALVYDLDECPLAALREIIRGTTFATSARKMDKMAKVMVKVSVRCGDDGAVGRASVAVLVVPHAVDIPKNLLKQQHPALLTSPATAPVSPPAPALDAAGGDAPAEDGAKGNRVAWPVLPVSFASNNVELTKLVATFELKLDRWGGLGEAPIVIQGEAPLITDALCVRAPGSATAVGGECVSPTAASEGGGVDVATPESVSLASPSPASTALSGTRELQASLVVNGDSIFVGKERVAEVSTEGPTVLSVTFHRTKHAAATLLPAVLSCVHVRGGDLPLASHDLLVAITIHATTRDTTRKIGADKQREHGPFVYVTEAAVRYSTQERSRGRASLEKVANVLVAQRVISGGTASTEGDGVVHGE